MSVPNIYMLRLRGVACRRVVGAVAGLVLALGLAGSPAVPTVAHAEEPVVRAVLFYSPACGHCHRVMTEDLPPLMARHGDALEIAAIDVTPDTGQALYDAAVERFGLQDRRGVPTLVVGDVVLVGSLEIPERFPGLVADYLAAGGTDWPDIPGLDAALATPAPSDEPSPAAPATTGPAASAGPVAPPAPATTSPASSAGAVPLAPDAGAPPAVDDVAARLGRDPIANGLAVLVLAAMIAAIGWAVWSVARAGADAVARPPSPWVAAVAVVGIGVAAYLAYVETAEVAAVCGPVGDCNAVQQSPYARLFGILPIGVLGLLGYAAILVAWAAARSGWWAAGVRPARVAILAMAFGGTLVSAYLTFLEPFVIGAVCAWCLTSAVIMTTLLVVAVRSMAAPSAAAAAPPAATAAS